VAGDRAPSAPRAPGGLRSHSRIVVPPAEASVRPSGLKVTPQHQNSPWALQGPPWAPVLRPQRMARSSPRGQRQSGPMARRLSSRVGGQRPVRPKPPRRLCRCGPPGPARAAPRPRPTAARCRPRRRRPASARRAEGHPQHRAAVAGERPAAGLPRCSVPQSHRAVLAGGGQRPVRLKATARTAPVWPSRGAPRVGALSRPTAARCRPRRRRPASARPGRRPPPSTGPACAVQERHLVRATLQSAEQATPCLNRGTRLVGLQTQQHTEVKLIAEVRGGLRGELSRRGQDRLRHREHGRRDRDHAPRRARPRRGAGAGPPWFALRPVVAAPPRPLLPGRQRPRLRQSPLVVRLRTGDAPLDESRAAAPRRATSWRAPSSWASARRNAREQVVVGFVVGEPSPTACSKRARCWSAWRSPAIACRRRSQSRSGSHG
jgi:hypothetical protein